MSVNQRIVRQRYRLLAEIHRLMEKPLIVLGIAWFGLIIVQLIWGLSGTEQTVIYVIWGIFIVDFGLRFIIAPAKIRFLKSNWFTGVALLAPALNILRIIPVLGALPSAQLQILRLLSGVNRAMAALAMVMGRRGFGYAVLLTTIVTLAGAAGMYGFERSYPGTELTSYGTSVWWTAMLMTTLGSDYFPHTEPGRILGLLLAIYAFSIFGYITASIASYFIDRDASSPKASVAGEHSVEALRRDISALRDEVRAFAGVKAPQTQ